MTNILKEEIGLKQIGPDKYTASWDQGWTVGDSELLVMSVAATMNLGLT